MTTSREYHAVTLLPNGMVLVVGVKGGDGDLYSAELYPLGTGE
jgi:hypothetical protein